VKKLAIALAAVIVSVLLWSQPAEARCWWNGWRWHCSHHHYSRHHYWHAGYYPYYGYHEYYRPYAYYRPYYWCFPFWPFCG
jgi:hypothetical protein